MKALKSPILRIEGEERLVKNLQIVSKHVEEITGMKLWAVKRDDLYRLMKLPLWSERYSVSIQYILSVLIPQYQKLSAKFSKKNTKGLGFTIPTLTGNNAESRLVAAIADDFPERENVHAARADALALAMKLYLREKPRVFIPSRSLLSYKSVDASLEVYKRQIEQRQKAHTAVAKALVGQPFRENPFRK